MSNDFNYDFILIFSGTLLTTTVFLHCIDPKQYHKETIENLQTLKRIDDLRAGYYDDLITKWSIEDQLTQDYKTNFLDFKIKFDSRITNLPHLQYYSYCENIDLSNQNLTSSILPSLELFQNCKVSVNRFSYSHFILNLLQPRRLLYSFILSLQKLSLENNQLTTLRNFPDLNLEVLNIMGNNGLVEEEVELFKKRCKYSVIF